MLLSYTFDSIFFVLGLVRLSLTSLLQIRTSTVKICELPPI